MHYRARRACRSGLPASEGAASDSALLELGPSLSRASRRSPMLEGGEVCSLSADGAAGASSARISPAWVWW